jgi:hypothetical protein
MGTLLLDLLATKLYPFFESLAFDSLPFPNFVDLGCDFCLTLSAEFLMLALLDFSHLHVELMRLLVPLDLNEVLLTSLQIEPFGSRASNRWEKGFEVLRFLCDLLLVPGFDVVSHLMSHFVVVPYLLIPGGVEAVELSHMPPFELHHLLLLTILQYLVILLLQLPPCFLQRHFDLVGLKVVLRLLTLNLQFTHSLNELFKCRTPDILEYKFILNWQVDRRRIGDY